MANLLGAKKPPNYFDQFDDWAPVGGGGVDDWQPVSGLPPGFELESGHGLPPGFELEAPRSSLAQELTGVPKQVGSSLIENLVGMSGTVPQGLNAIGSGISQITGLPEPAPIINAPPSPQGQLGTALPAPQSAAEELARNYGAFPFMGLTAKGHMAENILGGVGAGAGAYLGPQVAPYLGATPTEGAIGGALAGGFAGAHTAGNVANRITRSAMPNPQEILNATSNVYDDLRAQNRQIVVPPHVMGQLKNNLLQLLRQSGPAPEDAKSVYSIVNGLDADNGGTMADVINARKNLRAEFQGGPNANKPAAILALDVIDPLIDESGAPETLAKLKQADANWSAARTAQAVDTKITQAEDRAEGANSGLNLGNNIIQNINAYIKSRTDNVGKVHLNPSDLDALNAARKLNVGQQIGRYASNALAGGGGIGALLMGAAGGLGAREANEAGYSATEHDPLLGSLVLPALGLLGRYGFNSSVARAAKNAGASILARAPYMQGRAVPRALLSAPQVAGRSLLFAAPAVRDEFMQDAQ